MSFYVGIALFVLALLYVSLLWEIRRLRIFVHWQQNQLTWCRAVISLMAVDRDFKLPPDPLPPPDLK